MLNITQHRNLAQQAKVVLNAVPGDDLQHVLGANIKAGVLDATLGGLASVAGAAVSIGERVKQNMTRRQVQAAILPKEREFARILSEIDGPAKTGFLVRISNSPVSLSQIKDFIAEASAALSYGGRPLPPAALALLNELHFLKKELEETHQDAIALVPNGANAALGTAKAVAYLTEQVARASAAPTRVAAEATPLLSTVFHEGISSMCKPAAIATHMIEAAGNMKRINDIENKIETISKLPQYEEVKYGKAHLRRQVDYEKKDLAAKSAKLVAHLIEMGTGQIFGVPTVTATASVYEAYNKKQKSKFTGNGASPQAREDAERLSKETTAIAANNHLAALSRARDNIQHARERLCLSKIGSIVEKHGHSNSGTNGRFREVRRHVMDLHPHNLLFDRTTLLEQDIRAIKSWFSENMTPRDFADRRSSGAVNRINDQLRKTEAGFLQEKTDQKYKINRFVKDLVFTSRMGRLREISSGRP
ncbi:hypothetical protein [Paraburkholderia humisilvae]|uniref:Uncharacterized protein n=1 Tax=Paraburkholderia humisilvae TaxID=627669 RepID=A0A6J5F960_9BURK|nr:hypothetical protein [Paraburkholderia humisilvae]CAB3774913.1 hypothetical protein LMG29542_08295 [Paraburkholderia humisilvae]